MQSPPGPRLDYRRRKLIVRGEAAPPVNGPAGEDTILTSRSIALQLALYMLSVVAVSAWRATGMPHPQPLFGKLAVYAVLCALFGGIVYALASRHGSGKKSLYATVQVQALAILCAVTSLFLLNEISRAHDPQFWLVLSSVILVGTTAFLHTPLAAANYVALVLSGIIIRKNGQDWSGIVLVGITAAAVYGVARLQSLSFRLSIRKARETEERARTAQAVLRSFEESGSNWLWETGEDDQLTYVSPQFGRLLEQHHEALIGKKLIDLLHRHASIGDQKSGIRILEFNLAARLVFREVVVPLRVDGTQRWLSISGGPLFDTRNQFIGYSGIGADLTDARRSENQARQLALFDTLTGLANRAHFHDTLDELLERSLKRHSPCALLFIDLDRFKIVNDTLGHPVGDELLRMVAARIEQVINEKGQAGRLGGDEFVVVVPDGANRKVVSALATKLITEISAPYVISDSQIIIGASIGIATGPDDGATSDDLIRHADLALYAAKQAGRGAYRFYAAEMRAAAETRRSLEMDLRGALTNGELQVVYQPIFDVKEDYLAGFEALLRWNHPSRGMVSPEQFIPIAEESGLISQLGEWVLRTACIEASRWPDRVRVAINLSPVQFYSAGLTGVVMSALAASQIKPDRIELEITEGVFLQETTSTRLTLQQLHEMGVRLALDDFGTGYSSLGYLRKASFSKIKIDRSFVHGIDSPDSENVSIVRAVVALADSLGMVTTAEGAETPEEINALREIGCTQIQGFAYGRPMSFDAATALASALDSGVAQTILKPREPRVSMLRTARMMAAGTQHPAVIRNLSAGGLMAEVDAPVELGMEVTLAVPNFGNLKGTIRWIQGNRVGVLLEEQIDFQTVKHFTRRSARSRNTVGDNASQPKRRSEGAR